MSDGVTVRADVLIIGGGMAAAWAAIAAAKAGASTILVDKGYVGTSGVTATAGPNHWWVPPDPVRRREIIERKWADGFGLGDPAWMERIIDMTWRAIIRSDRMAGAAPIIAGCAGRNICARCAPMPWRQAPGSWIIIRRHSCWWIRMAQSQARAAMPG
jgi:hypothetical protein